MAGGNAASVEKTDEATEAEMLSLTSGGVLGKIHENYSFAKMEAPFGKPSPLLTDE